MAKDREYVQMNFTIHKTIFNRLTRIKNSSGLKHTEEAKIALAKYCNEHPITIKFEQEQALKNENR
jgi:hypothetical protein